MTVYVPTANELLYLRTDGQFSKLYLAFPQPAIVFKARVNNPAVGTDMQTSIIWDTNGMTPHGVYTDILPDMTLLVGTVEGGRDLGIARIRKTCTATKLYIGEESEVKLADNVFLTVIDEYGLWPRHKYVKAGASHQDFMDFDVTYTTQHETLDPVPILGPDRVLWYQGTLAAHPGNSISTQFDASESYCLSSAGAKTYLWTAATGTIDDNTIANPTIHFHSTGTHRVSCRVTIAAKPFTGYRTVMVYDDTFQPIKDFKLISCTGDYEMGGWSFKVSMYDNADLALVVDRAKVMLFARDWYGDITNLTSTAISFDAATKRILKASGLSIFTKGMTIKVSGSANNNGEYIVVVSNDAYLTVDKVLVDESAGASMTIQVLRGQTEISIGQIVGCENIISSGWISQENLNMDIHGGTAEFTVQGPQYWLGQMQGFISGLIHSETAPTEWNYMLDLTVDKGLWDLLHWRSTATRVIDCFLTGDVKLIPTMESNSVGSLWEQLKGQAWETILATPCCDRYGRLFIEISGQLIPIGDRSFTNVMTIEAYDRTDEITVERITVKPVGAVDLTGVWFDGVTGYALRALANGHMVSRYGYVEAMDKVLMEDQAHANELASLLYAQKNNEYPSISINILENLRLVDICPTQQVTIVTDTDTNPREIEISNLSFPRRITFLFSEVSKSISVQLDAEPEVTTVGLSITGKIPIVKDDPTDYPYTDWEIPVYPPWPPLPPWPLPPIPVYQDPATCQDIHTGPYYAIWDRTYINGDSDAITRTAKIWFNCVVRNDTAANPTFLAFTVNAVDVVCTTRIHVYAVDASGVELSESNSVYVDTFDGTSYRMIAVFNANTLNYNVAGFQLVMDEGWSAVGPAFDQTLHGSGFAATALEDPAHNCFATVTDAGTVTVIDPNQLEIKWAGNSIAESGIYGDTWYSAGILFNAHIHLAAGGHSKIWAYAKMKLWGGIEGVSGPLIADPGPDGFDMCFPQVDGSMNVQGNTYSADIGEVSADTPFTGGWRAGSLQSTTDNPCTRGQLLYVEGTLILIASNDQPTPLNAGLGNVEIYNVCPAV